MSKTSNEKSGFHYLMPGTGSTSAVVRPIESAFAAAAAVTDGAAVPHAAAHVTAADILYADFAAGAVALKLQLGIWIFLILLFFLSLLQQLLLLPMLLLLFHL